MISARRMVREHTDCRRAYWDGYHENGRQSGVAFVIGVGFGFAIGLITATTIYWVIL